MKYHLNALLLFLLFISTNLLQAQTATSLVSGAEEKKIFKISQRLWFTLR